jgi:hypothetical protein
MYVRMCLTKRLAGVFVHVGVGLVVGEACFFRQHVLTGGRDLEALPHHHPLGQQLLKRFGVRGGDETQIPGYGEIQTWPYFMGVLGCPRSKICSSLWVASPWAAGQGLAACSM